MKKILILILFALACTHTLYAEKTPNGDWVSPPNRNAVVKLQHPLEANNIRAFVWNTGVFNQDLRTTNTPGFYWPKSQNKAAIFTSGLSIACMYEGQLRAAMASYAGEYSPGYIDETGTYKTDSRFKIYSVKSGDNQFTNPDHANWGLMVPFGAPYVDINQNGQWDLGTDIPGIKDAGQTIFICLSDGDPDNHSSSEGFSGGTLPIKAEVHLTAWAYGTAGLEDLQFVQWVVINKSNVAWNSTYMSIVVDPDLGDAADDYIGCDTNLNMGICYNADDQDGTGGGITYGPRPPSSGMDYFLSPIIPTGNQNDTVKIYPQPGTDRVIIKTGYRQLGSTSFVYFTNPGSGGPSCEQDPHQLMEAYNYMKGVKRDGTQWVNVLTNQTTKFCYPGDPESNTGWTEYQGRLENCGGPTGNLVAPSPPGDRRFIFNSGGDDFTINPGDTQYVVLGQMVARGSNNKHSVTLLKDLDEIAQIVFNLNFKVIPPPPQPQVNASYSPNSDLGTTDITLSWGDVSESYLFDDQLFMTGFYKFQGYEIYEIRKDLNVFPDFNNPLSSKDGLSLLAIYDLREIPCGTDTTTDTCSIGQIFDSLKTGSQLPNGDDQYAWLTVVPAVGFPVPAGFPNTGLSRHITLRNTRYTEVNGGTDRFIYGNTYKFAVVAYGYNKNGKKGGKVVRNSISSSVTTLVPEAPLAGTEFFYKNGDTLGTNRRDLALMPIVMSQENVIDAKYRIQFNFDTTYNILRSVDNGGSFQTLKAGLKSIAGTNPTARLADDSSRIYDGILFKFLKIRYNVLSPPGTFTGNYGVIYDNTATLTPDSIQTNKKGWDYFPSENRKVEGSKYLIATTRPYQSVSMGLSYPSRQTYVGLRSGIGPETCRKVQILFTGYGNGQQAYRYLSISANQYTYQDQREVPFKVFEIDGTDGTPNPRQLNCAFLEFPVTAGGAEDTRFEPTADSTGGKEVLYIFNSDYNATPDPIYTAANLLIGQQSLDVMYIWSPKLITAGSFFTNNDQLIIYPYTITQPELGPGSPLYYEVDTRKPTIGSITLASQNNALGNIRVVPNPYYGFNALETSTSGRFVTFRNLPKEVTIKIFTLNGDMVRNISKNDNNSTTTWNLQNQDNIPVASGIYIAMVDAPGIGQRSIKIAVFTPEERIDF